MVLRIRKEDQDRLKTLLDAPSDQPAPARTEGAAPAAPFGAVAKTATASDVAAFDALFTPEAGQIPAAAPVEPPEPAELVKADARTDDALVIIPAPAEIQKQLATIEALFDVLIRYAPDPATLRALRALTAHYLGTNPSRDQTDMVLMLLHRQADIIKGALTGGSAAAPVATVDLGIAASATKAAEAPQARAGETPAAPPPAAAPAADAGVTALSARRRMVGWLRRRGGRGGGSGDGTTLKPPSRSQLKTALMASVWLGVGGLTIAYAGTLIYINVMRLEIDTAMISGAVEPVNATADGIVQTLLVRNGDVLHEGARFITLEDPEVEKLVKLASVKVERAREDYRLKQAEFEVEKAKRDEFLTISRNKLDKIDVEVEGLETQHKVAVERFNRLSDLYKKGLTIRPRVEEASDRLAEVNSQLQRARINQRERTQLQDGVSGGNYFNGSAFVGKFKEAEATAARASAEVDLALEELQVLQQRRSVNRIAAAHDMRILKVLRPEGSAVRRGDTVLVAERLNERQIQAFVRQEQANVLAIGDEAMVFVPSLRAKVKARIVQVERNAAFLDDVDARYTWKMARDTGVKPNDKDRSARVVLKFEGLDEATAQKTFEIGMPTVVSFQRRSINTVLSGFTEIGTKL